MSLLALEQILLMWSDQERLCLIVRPRYLMESTLSISDPSKFNGGCVVFAFFHEITMNLHLLG